MKKKVLLGALLYGNFFIGMYSCIASEKKHGEIIETDKVKLSDCFKAQHLPIDLILTSNFYKRPEPERTTITVVARRQQNELQESNLGSLGATPDVAKKKFSQVNVLPDALEKLWNSNCSYHEPSIIVNDLNIDIQNLYKLSEKITYSQKLLALTEPELFYSSYMEQFTYYAKRRIDEHHISDPEYQGEKALIEVEKDLILCYTTVLEKAFKWFSANDKKTLAFPLLSKFFEVPVEIITRSAVRSIVDFLKSSSFNKEYERVQLVVEHKEDYEACLKLLQELLLQK